MQRATPLPLKTLSILSIIILCEPMSLTIIFPFIYKMVGQWVEREQDIGYYCGSFRVTVLTLGFIASSFSLAQFVSSIPWGKLSDRFGRKPCLLLGLLGNSITIITFGLSQSLWQAVLSRSLNGILNGMLFNRVFDFTRKYWGGEVHAC
jgi:MFS family permease